MSKYNLVLDGSEPQTVKDLDLSQGGVFHSLTYGKEGRGFLLEFKVGRDSSSSTSCTSLAMDSAQFPSPEPDHGFLTV